VIFGELLQFAFNVASGCNFRLIHSVISHCAYFVQHAVFSLAFRHCDSQIVVTRCTSEMAPAHVQYFTEWHYASRFSFAFPNARRNLEHVEIWSQRSHTAALNA
jgi:hypothetical protein